MINFKSLRGVSGSLTHAPKAELFHGLILQDRNTESWKIGVKVHPSGEVGATGDFERSNVGKSSI